MHTHSLFPFIFSPVCLKMSDTNNNNGGSNSNNSNNWLGFSLSPHMKMESSPSEHHYLHEAPPTTTGFFLNSYENGAFHSPLSFMPLKSDGSLCIMEALSGSHPSPQGMVSSSASPKLEDFLGAHHYQDSQGVPLSLDTIYYQSAAAADKPHSLHPHHFYSGLAAYHQEDTAHLAAAHQIKNWVAGLDHQEPNNGMPDHASGSVPAAGGGLQSLSLSMSPGSQSSCVTAPGQISPTGTECGAAVDTRKRGPGKAGQKKQPVHRKSIDTFGQRTSQYRGVTRHRWTGRYEAHLWDNSCKKEGQTRKGRQVYLGGYDMEDKAARAYDLAALKYWGPSTHINFPLENYQTELEVMKNMSRQEFVAHLRRKSSGFSRGASMYRGVTRHHQHGRWQARIGRVAGNKDLYLGTFSTQEEAAEAYDVAAIKFRGVNAVTNFDITRYNVERIMASNTLLSGELARRSKDTGQASIEIASYQQNNGEASIQAESNSASDWKMALYQSQQDQEADPFGGERSMSNGGSYRTSSFSMALHDLIGMGNADMEEAGKVQGQGAAHFSNPSSLVTSLGSSREGSPDKNGAPMLFAKPPLASKFISPAVAPVSSWFPTAQPASHLPVFAAWNDT